MGDFKKLGDPSNGGMVLKWWMEYEGESDTPLQTVYVLSKLNVKFYV